MRVCLWDSLKVSGSEKEGELRGVGESYENVMDEWVRDGGELVVREGRWVMSRGRRAWVMGMCVCGHERQSEGVGVKEGRREGGKRRK